MARDCTSNTTEGIREEVVTRLESPTGLPGNDPKCVPADLSCDNFRGDSSNALKTARAAPTFLFSAAFSSHRLLPAGCPLPHLLPLSAPDALPPETAVTEPPGCGSSMQRTSPSPPPGPRSSTWCAATRWWCWSGRPAAAARPVPVCHPEAVLRCMGGPKQAGPVSSASVA